MTLHRQLFGASASNSWVRILILFIFAWAFLLYFFVTKLNTTQQTHVESMDTTNRINAALQLLEHSKQRNEELRQMIDELLSDQMDQHSAQILMEKLENNLQNSLGDNAVAMMNAPQCEASIAYELTRRRVQTNINEMWYFFSAELGNLRAKLSKKAPELQQQIDNMLLHGVEHKRALLNDMQQLPAVDGHAAWRQKEAKDLSDLMQRRLYKLQNPDNCNKARKLVCKLNKGCGYGCQLHHLTYCFIVGYATERTVILKSRGWRYHRNGWEEIFKPVSDSCTEAGSLLVKWPAQHNTPVVVLPLIDSLEPRPPYLPQAIPADLSERLQRLHGDPIVWWVGEILKFLLRPQPRTKQFLENGMKKLGFKTPIVGIHVRRTDKVGTEAAFHKLEEYMTYVEDYYLTQEMNGTTMERRVFVASDDPHAIEEARKKFPQYEVIGDLDIASMAAVSTRYSDSSLNGIILDIHLLSLCDFLVCTFSSQVCRVAYEIMQSLRVDAAHRVKSLDDIYYFGGQNAHNWEAVIPHEPRNHDEIELKSGDVIGVAGNHWNGFSKGRNRRTNQQGLFPAFKTVNKVDAVKMPLYTKA